MDLTLTTLLSHTVPEISVEELSHENMNEILLLDSREKVEYDVSQMKNARFVGYGKFDIKTLKNIPKDTKIVVYCSVGYRSEKVAEKIIAAGFTNVSNLYGGIFEWKNKGHKVYDSHGKETEKVHAFDKVWGLLLRSGEKVY